jgi:hypothetical protein
MTNAWKATVRLHVMVLSEPTPPVTRQAMVDEMTEIYRTVQIDVVASEEIFELGKHPVLEGLNESLDVGACAMGSTTDDQNTLFGYPNNAGPHEICIYFVSSTFPPSSGCGAFPAGKRGAVIASCASLWTLGHECGHVLGLGHVEPEDPEALMTGAGTSNLTPPPEPALTNLEAATMIATLNQ